MIGIQVSTAPATTGTGKGQVNVSRTPPVTLQLGELALEIPEPWVIDLGSVPIPQTTAGLVGAELFKRYVVRIDPTKATITVFDPPTYKPEAGAESIPLTVEGDKLFLEATLDAAPGRVVTQKLRIDTGSESSVNHEIARDAAEVQKSTLGGGLGENFEGYSGRLRAVKLGSHVIKDVWAPGGPNPAIGMELLRRFILTFDAPHGRLYLERTAQFDEPVPPVSG
jgi:hypothetical protein